MLPTVVFWIWKRVLLLPKDKEFNLIYDKKTLDILEPNFQENYIQLDLTFSNIKLIWIDMHGHADDFGMWMLGGIASDWSLIHKLNVFPEARLDTIISLYGNPEWEDEDGCYNSSLFKNTEQFQSYTEVRSHEKCTHKNFYEAFSS